MRILMIAKTLTAHRSGGFETHVTQLANRLAERHEVDVICRRLPVGKNDYNFNVYDIPYSGIGIDAIDNLATLPFLKKEIEKLSRNNYDIVHGQGFSSCAYFLTKEKKPFVYTLHGISAEHLVGYREPMLSVLKILFDAEKYCVDNADKIICVSKRTMKEAPKYYGFSKNKCVYIPNGVDVLKFRQKRMKSKKPTIGFVGFLHEHKGVHFLLNAMSYVVREIPDAFLVIIGTGSGMKRFKRMTSNLGISKNVFFAGRVLDEDLIRWYNTFDLFVLPSQYEGFGLVVLEAMAAGTPVIVSDTGNLPELAKDSGFVVDPENTTELSDKIIKILLDENLRKRLSKNCLRKIKKFDWKYIVKKTEKLYENLLDEKNGIKEKE
jgi:glycosyltransferase involved in cell wall biosynthesis